MKTKFFILFFSLLFPFFIHAQPTFRTGVAQGWVIAFPNGKATPKAPTTLLVIGVGHSINEWLGWYSEVGLTTPNTIFHPSPRGHTGPTFKFGSFTSQVAVLYQFNPSYDGASFDHLVAFAPMVGVIISKEITLAWTMGFGRLLESRVWFLSLGPKLSFLLPF